MSESLNLRDVLIILMAAVAIVPVFRRFRANAVLGYLVAGALIGPHGLGLLRDIGATRVMGELGVVFLLFSLGLELSIERITYLRSYVFGLGSAQLVATGLVVGLAARAVGVPSGAALVLGAGLALSSTAVVFQMLTQRRETRSPPGRIAVAVLLLQDLAVLPLLTLIPLLGRPESGILPALSVAFLKAAAAFLIIFAAGRLALRPLLRAVARGGDPELFTGIALLLVLGVGWLTQLAGLSMALGAFLAGLLIAETEYRPQVEGDIQPFRGILLALFFMTVGMNINLGLLGERGPLLAALLVMLLAIKAGVLALVSRGFGLSWSAAASVGIMLAQGGEFGFVLFGLARERQVLTQETEQVAILVVALSMAITPLLITASRALARRLPAGEELPHEAGSSDLRDHVLIAGFGRVGQTLALLLESRHVPYAALDLDHERVAEARNRGLPVFYGDASRVDVLRAIGVERARVAVITLDQPESAGRTVHVLRRLLPELPILVRARDVAQCERLALAGATDVVPEVVEGSLQLGGSLLRLLGQPREEVERVLEEFRLATYARLGEIIVGRGAESPPLREPGPA
ncbi:MAG TPA: cation:proton antiporter [Gemmatimonadales bacterium]|jgi:CPA2 family monovalent cation:H+ antiporter-2